MKTCEQHVDVPFNGAPNIFLCGKPAKWMTPNHSTGKVRPVCGIHRRTVDKFFERNGLDLKCIPIEGEEK